MIRQFAYLIVLVEKLRWNLSPNDFGENAVSFCHHESQTTTPMIHCKPTTKGETIFSGEGRVKQARSVKC